MTEEPTPDAKMLRRKQLRDQLCLRPIEPGDNQAIAQIILSVLNAFVGERAGFANRDPEINDMYQYYQSARSCFFVASVAGQVVGGAGIAPLAGEQAQICELRKMYLLPEFQGFGIGRDLIRVCLDFARSNGYTKCYLETLHSMAAANALYDGFGFKELSAPLGCTGHHGCDRWRSLNL